MRIGAKTMDKKKYTVIGYWKASGEFITNRRHLHKTIAHIHLQCNLHFVHIILVLLQNIAFKSVHAITLHLTLDQVKSTGNFGKS